ncbi:MAG: septum formation initiator family protein [Aurantimicrobium sp.]|jgi:cell division protein FtsB|nr:septum formation initiator family protein [Aurantimicrobium sp.]
MDPKRPDVRGVNRDNPAGAPKSRPGAVRTKKVRSEKPRATPETSTFRLKPARTWVRARTEVTPSGERRLGLWLGSFRISGATILMLALVIMGVGVLGPQINVFVEQRRDVADLEEVVREKELAIDALEKQRARWEDPAYIRAQARERLFYVMPGDISFIVISDVPIVERPLEKPSTSVQSTKSDWVRGIFNSVMVAGLSDATPAELDAAANAPGSR